MPPLVYSRDSGLYGRMAALEERVRRLESGGLLSSSSVLVQASQTLAGPWPQSVSFNVNNLNSKVVIFWSATSYVSTNITLVLVLKVDGTQVDSDSLVSSNSVGTRLGPLKGTVTLTGLTAGSHTAQVAITAGTTDSNDKGHILVLEFPQ